MKFGPVPLGDALGAIAAHAIRLSDGIIKKGVVLGPVEVARLAERGIGEVVAARLDPDDVPEDVAARRLAEGIAGEGARVDRSFTGRCNLFAERPGLLLVDRAAIDRVNAVNEAITVATLEPFKPVAAGEMIATVKIIPFAVPESQARAALAAAGSSAPLAVAPWRGLELGVVSTLLPGLKQAVIRKTIEALARRIEMAGARVVMERESAHEPVTLAEELGRVVARCDLAVVFGASAITDRRDVIPAAIERAGGRIEHFGMPVDPGNLLLIGEIAGKPVIGAPGCARSPKENGFDWVLRRYLAGLTVSRADIAGLGVGGLLMEVTQRGQPRQSMGEP